MDGDGVRALIINGFRGIRGRGGMKTYGKRGIGRQTMPLITVHIRARSSPRNETQVAAFVISTVIT